MKPPKIDASTFLLIFTFGKPDLDLMKLLIFCSLAASNSVAVITVTSEIPLFKLYNLKKELTFLNDSS